MKIIQVTKTIDDETFAPILAVKLSIPLEMLQDSQFCPSVEEFEAIIGKEFLKQLKENIK